MNPQTRQYISDNRSLPADTIASQLAEDFTTSQKIDRKELAAHLLTVNLSTRFRAALASGKLPEPLQAGLQKLIDTLSWGIDFVDTTKPEIALEVVGLLQGLLSEKVIIQEEVTDLIALSGGFRYDRLSSKEIQTEIDRLGLSENFQVFRAKVAEGYNSVIGFIEEQEIKGNSVAEADLIKLFSEKVK